MLPGKRFWDAYARHYDRVLGVLHGHQQLRKVIQEDVGELPCGATVLDIGCGTGFLLRMFGESQPDLQLVGVDASSEMLAIATRRLPGAKLIRADVNTQEGLQSISGLGGAHLVLMTNVVYALRNPEQTLASVVGEMRPGGRLLIVNPWRTEHGNIWRDHFRWADKASFDDQRETFRALPSIAYVWLATEFLARMAQKGDLHFYSPEAFQRMLEDLGLRVEIIRERMLGETCCLILAEKGVRHDGR